MPKRTKTPGSNYDEFHIRVRTTLGRATHCQCCGRTEAGGYYEWANLSGAYEVIHDYLMLCRRCHRRYDAARRALTRTRTVPDHLQRQYDNWESSRGWLNTANPLCVLSREDLAVLLSVVQKSDLADRVGNIVTAFDAARLREIEAAAKENAP